MCPDAAAHDPRPTDPGAGLASLVHTWSSAADDLVALLDDLPDPLWSTPTNLTGWDVHAVVSHVAHLEHLLAGGPHDEVDGIEVGSPAHVLSPLGVFTEQGVVARRDRTPDELREELRSAVGTRRRDLADNPPDPEASAPGLFGQIGWSMATLLTNRPLDVWMHDQDVRDAVDRPGAADGPGARHTVTRLSRNLPLLLAKRAGAPAGSTAVLEVDGVGRWAAGVGSDGRGSVLDTVPAEPDVTLRMTTPAFAMAAGGRRALRTHEVRVTGDADLGARLLASFAMTP